MIKIGIDLSTTISGIFVETRQYHKSSKPIYKKCLVNTTGITDLKEIYKVWCQKLNLFENIQIKTFNSNEWQFKIGCIPQDQRPVRKQKAREFAIKNYPDQITEQTSQDIVDACCICHFLNELHTTQQQNEAVKAQKKQKEQTKSKKILLQQKIITLQSKISTLDALKNKKRINTLTNQLNMLKEELNNV